MLYIYVLVTLLWLYSRIYTHRPNEVWKRCRDNEVLRVKGEKVSFGKYQQTVFNSRRTLHQFALKGFYFGIAARKLDLKALQSSALPSKPLRKAAIANQTELPTGGPTLKQEKVDLDKLSINPVNQLDRAAVTFNTIENYHKSFIATSVLTHTADYHTKQAKTFRSTEKRHQVGIWPMQRRLPHTRSPHCKADQLHTKLPELWHRDLLEKATRRRKRPTHRILM